MGKIDNKTIRVLAYSGAALAAVGLGFVVFKTGKEAVGSVVEAVPKTLNAIDPRNHDNIFNRFVSDLGAEITGDPQWSLGGQIYDWTH